jgi:hypothetical protein
MGRVFDIHTGREITDEVNDPDTVWVVTYDPLPGLHYPCRIFETEREAKYFASGFPTVHKVEIQEGLFYLEGEYDGQEAE